MKTDELKNLMQWIQQTTSNLEYGTVSVEIKLHAGKIRLVEKTVTEREQPGGYHE